MLQILSRVSEHAQVVIGQLRFKGSYIIIHIRTSRYKE